MTLIWDTNSQPTLNDKNEGGLNYSSTELADFKKKNAIADQPSQWERELAEAKQRIADREKS